MELQTKRPANPKLVLLNKPYGVASQFTGEETGQTLKSFIPHNDIYPVGRLDNDTEGLLLLTNEEVYQTRIENPGYNVWQTYWVQIENESNEEQLRQLQGGVELNGKVMRPLEVFAMPEPLNLWPRNPPVRVPICNSWLCIKIQEETSGQLRQILAHIGLPALRLIRAAVGPFQLKTLRPGEWRSEPPVW